MSLLGKTFGVTNSRVNVEVLLFDLFWCTPQSYRKRSVYHSSKTGLYSLECTPDCPLFVHARVRVPHQRKSIRRASQSKHLNRFTPPPPSSAHFSSLFTLALHLVRQRGLESSSFPGCRWPAHDKVFSLLASRRRDVCGKKTTKICHVQHFFHSFSAPSR